LKELRYKSMPRKVTKTTKPEKKKAVVRKSKTLRNVAELQDLTDRHVRVAVCCYLHYFKYKILYLPV
jgi:hypothetical protein